MKSSKKTTDSSLDPSIASLNELFRGALREVSFPGVDASILSAAIEGLERELLAARETANALAAAEARVAEQREMLVAKCHLAFAYARVFAKDDAELLAALDRIALPKATGRERVSERSLTDAERPTRARRSKAERETKSTTNVEVDDAVAAE